MGALGRAWRGRKYSGAEMPVFLEAKNLLPFGIKVLDPVLTPVEFAARQSAKTEDKVSEAAVSVSVSAGRPSQATTLVVRRKEVSARMLLKRS
jgi:hypothetical protein